MVVTGQATVRNLVPMLAVESGERTVDFYVNKLGFTLLNSIQVEGRVGWCLLGAGGPSAGPDSPWRVEIMFSVTGLECAHDRDTRKGVILYLYPDDIAALHALYKSRGLRVGELRVTFYHMKEFELEDPDGYQIWFGQETTEPPTQPNE